MMTSVGSDRSRGTRDKTQAQTQAQIQKPVQATAEQIRLAQMIYDKNDVDFEEKVKQLMEVTGKNPDECIVALHDCNGDVNRAINILLEGNSDTNSWETVGKKKSLGTVKDNLENKEKNKRGEKETSQVRGSSTRRGKASRGREYRLEENGVDISPGDRHSERSRRARGRGYSGRSRGRGAARFSAQGMGTFNPADYPDSTATDETAEIWESGQNNGTGTWQNSMEDWVSEDWNEDQLTETKVFTASTAAGMDSQTIPGSSTDLATLLQKPSTGTVTENNSSEAPQQANLSQSLVFTNSQHDDPISSVEGNSNAVNSYSQNLTPKFGELTSTKIGNSSGLQLVDQLKPAGLVEVPPPSTEQNNNKHSWEAKSASQSAVLSNFDFKIQPDPSPVLRQITQQQQQSSVQPVLDSFSSQIKLREPLVDGSATKVMQLLPSSTDNQIANVQQTQQKQLKTQKRKIPPSKIPASAVEMPGSTDVSGLNVQFGALEFGSEPSLTEFQTGSTETISQTQNHLFSNSVSDSVSQFLLISSAVEESSNPSAITSSSSAVSQNTTVTSMMDQTSVHGMPYQNSVDTSPKEASLQNSHNGLGAQQALEVPQHSSNLNQTIELPSSSLSQHSSSSMPNHQTSSLVSTVSSLTTSSSHAHTNVDSSLQTSTTFPTSLTFATITTSSVNVSSSLSATTSLGLNVSSPSMAAAVTRAVPSVSSGKAPPNLPQGVPPILHNQYIVGPGGLLPAYPIYGYDDLQVLQSRLPMDYYGMAFPAPATALASRDGNLASNPYSGDLTKFGRGDSASPAPATTLTQPQQNQTQSHHTTQQAFLNPALPPGYSYTGLPYYAGMPGVPSTFQYGPAMFVPPASAKHGMNMNTASTPFQQASNYGQHGYGAAGYDEINQGTGAGDYSKGAYSGSSQAQTKSSTAGPGKGISVNSTNIGVPDMTGSVYKTQGGSGQRNQQNGIPQKSQVNKPNYGTSPYWGN
ncbi:ubiquitin-associated protein 2a isoform X9 [Mobula birostris]|uniref:ubiquitin-associated protein 2a isoform X9 n=1 Tax=Mobula birostris TaxID=1983395 RepID=UPI003B2894B0